MAALTKLEEGKNWSIWTDGKNKCIKIERIRLSYPFVGSVRENTDEKTGKTRKGWNFVGMLPKKTHKEAKDACVKVINELLTKNEAKVAAQNKFIRDGDGEGVEQKEYAEHWTLHCSNSDSGQGRRHTVRNVKGEIVSDEGKIDNMFYGGCWGSVMIRPWYFNGKAKGDPNTYPKRVSASFVTIQFVKDDEPFGDGHVNDDAAWGGSGDDDDDGLGGGSSVDDDDDGL